MYRVGLVFKRGCERSNTVTLFQDDLALQLRPNGTLSPHQQAYVFKRCLCEADAVLRVSRPMQLLQRAICHAEGTSSRQLVLLDDVEEVLLRRYVPPKRTPALTQSLLLNDRN